MVEEGSWPGVRNFRLIELPKPSTAEEELHREDEAAEGTYSHPVKCECNDVELNTGCPIHKEQARLAQRFTNAHEAT